MRSEKKEGWSVGFIAAVCVFGWTAVALAQPAMPDPRQMSGIPRPVTDLPDRSVSVRLIRGDLSNNIAGHPVDLQVGSEVRTVRTDENGRAQFDDLPAGVSLRAVAVVDEERLESQQFAAPSAGGVRLLLVATDPDRQARLEAGAVPGDVVLGSDSRIVVEVDEEQVRVFYLLRIVNSRQAPVNPTMPFIFDTPRGALSTTIMQGSSSQASASGDTVRVLGPFEPGETYVQVGFVLPTPDGTVELTQAFPAPLEQFVVFVQKVGDAKLTSPDFSRQQEMPAGGDVLIVGINDNQIAAGQAVSFTITGLPHHSSAPRIVAIAVAAAVLLFGAWAAWQPEDPAQQAAARKRLIARREKLFQELVRLEGDHRRVRIDDARYLARRRDLIASLEHLYRALDASDSGSGTGVAA